MLPLVHRRTRVEEASTRTNLYNNNYNDNLFLIRCKLTSEYVHMCLTTITTCNDYNNVYLRIPKIYNLKFVNLTITGKSLPKYIWNFMTTRFIM